MVKNAGLIDATNTDLLRKILIVQLAIEGVPQQNIRAIVGCDLNKVTAVVKLVNTKADKKKLRRG